MSFINIVRTAGNVQGIVGAVKNFANSLMSFFGVDIVGVFDNETYDQIFAHARPLKGHVARAVKIMDHPIETGAVISDFAVTMPVEAEITFIIPTSDYDQVLMQITSYMNRRVPVFLQFKALSKGNMLIETIVHDEDAEVFDAAVVTVRFREVQYVTVQYQSLPASAVQQPTDQSTVNSGVQQPKESALYQLTNYAKGFFK